MKYYKKNELDKLTLKELETKIQAIFHVTEIARTQPTVLLILSMAMWKEIEGYKTNRTGRAF